MTQKTTQLHVVPKADVERMFEELYRHIPRNCETARKLRGLVYANTFLAQRTITITEPEDNGSPARHR